MSTTAYPELACPICTKVGQIKDLHDGTNYGCWGCYNVIPIYRFNLIPETYDDGSEEVKD